MRSGDAEIKGIKPKVIEEYSLSQGSGPSNDSWKSLMSSAKDTPLQYDHMNRESLKKYFNPNAQLIEDPLDKPIQYRVCEKCGKPLALTAIVDHLENHCAGASGKSSTDPRDESTRETIRNGVESTGGNNNDDDNSNDNNNDDDDDNDDNEDDDDDDDDDDNSNGANYKKNDSSFNPLKRSTSMESANTPNMDTKRSKTGTPQTFSSSIKKQKKVKQRNPTEKHLIDFNKQCGVELPEGGYCARSLTCKSHSMGAKRAVSGRSKPYDVLLADYHREHQTKIGAAAEKRAKQQELQKLQKQIQKEQKKHTQQQKQGQRSKQRNVNGGKSAKNGGKSTVHNGNNINEIGHVNLTPEEETTQVLNGVSRSFPLPLESTVLSSVRYRTKYFRMREMFASSFSVKPGYTSPGYGAIHSRVGCLDLDRTTDYKFRVRTPQPINHLTNQNLNPKQIQRLQQQRALQAQLLSQQQQQQQQQQQHHSPQAQAQASTQQPTQGMVPNHFPGGATNSSFNANVSSKQIQQQQQQHKSQDTGLTPLEIQSQQQKLRQQQLQQQKFEAAASYLANATKLMQESNQDSHLSGTHNNNSSKNGNNNLMTMKASISSPNTSVNSIQSPPSVNSVNGSGQGVSTGINVSGNNGRIEVGIGNSVNPYNGRIN
ncbi:ASB_HP2_G0019700.mRNA.1.CDS.1 [Saccharomyces cerevisiae]|nr:ASB_HP2_G0019700.mRNA.1.CDS.1 [Saccharomyces cerevisiae]CAI6518276.1 ASB_HP2_G0019700.mRNA.1.CDS.1 [Saccharomyces cerevisiae]